MGAVPGLVAEVAGLACDAGAGDKIIGQPVFVCSRQLVLWTVLDSCVPSCLCDFVPPHLLKEQVAMQSA